MPLSTITTTNLTKLFAIIFVLSTSILINPTVAAAGYCYQCNSRNPSCGLTVDAKLKIDATPCNGQCYVRLNRDDEFTVYRGCSWEHGFMKAQEKNVLVLKGNSVWTFCDTPYCNGEATSLLTTVCYQPICDYLKFPEDCKLPNADVTCGRACNNKLCNTKALRDRKPTRNRNRYQKVKASTTANAV